MKESIYQQNSNKLTVLLEKAGFQNRQELSKIAGISQWQLTRIEYGLMHRVALENLLSLSAALKISLEQLITTFVSQSQYLENWQPQAEQRNLAAENQEYQRLQNTIEQQKETLESEFRNASLQVIESWLLQWPTAVAAIAKNPELPAKRLLLLMKPIEELISYWGVEAIYTVGEELPYDPQWHELIKGDADLGDMVQVRYVGYKQGEKILYKAKVSTVEIEN
ncbi:GrpE protein,Helix-turn-helix protein [Xenococcus sp. PCC 7305]|uniref:helix-turn-helix domain-containing protein n=1 Tax=Xenococcus sp. PCC 7305 TaxID=102125 RepID=UPI0002AB9B90|nr:helix-turn-helix domain-containing protein [Xenococcus sp. PCC 7305]ELS05565.1 GrpE protein,Helix-turn-helix protein [Xenococcus sp. PCC 7305]